MVTFTELSPKIDKNYIIMATRFGFGLISAEHLVR